MNQGQIHTFVKSLFNTFLDSCSPFNICLPRILNIYMHVSFRLHNFFSKAAAIVSAEICSLWHCTWSKLQRMNFRFPLNRKGFWRWDWLSGEPWVDSIVAEHIQYMPCWATQGEKKPWADRPVVWQQLLARFFKLTNDTTINRNTVCWKKRETFVYLVRWFRLAVMLVCIMLL